MSNILTAVKLFLNQPITSQVTIMRQYGFDATWNNPLNEQRVRFFHTLRHNDEASEFCEDMILRFSKET